MNPEHPSLEGPIGVGGEEVSQGILNTLQEEPEKIAEYHSRADNVILDEPYQSARKRYDIGFLEPRADDRGGGEPIAFRTREEAQQALQEAQFSAKTLRCVGYDPESKTYYGMLLTEH